MRDLSKSTISFMRSSVQAVKTSFFEGYLQDHFNILHNIETIDIDCPIFDNSKFLEITKILKIDASNGIDFRHKLRSAVLYYVYGMVRYGSYASSDDKHSRQKATKGLKKVISLTGDLTNAINELNLLASVRFSESTRFRQMDYRSAYKRNDYPYDLLTCLKSLWVLKQGAKLCLSNYYNLSNPLLIKNLSIRRELPDLCSTKDSDPALSSTKADIFLNFLMTILILIEDFL
jgi:hypothetical protein